MQQLSWMERIKHLKQARTTLAQILVGVTLLCLPQQGHAVSFTVGSATVSVGEVFTINLSVADAVNLTSWQFDLAYDPTILQANSVTEGPFLSSAGSTLFVPGFIDNTAGLIGGVSAFFTDFTTPPSGSGILATIQFTALSSGLSSLTASNVFLDLQDPTSGGFTIGNGTVDGGRSPIPEASTISLMALGMLLLLGLRRWRDAGKPAEAHR
jgi:Cohesin domain